MKAFFYMNIFGVKLPLRVLYEYINVTS
jgi:hypothetical protein